MVQKIHDLARNQEFLRLHRELNKFNIFHATGMRNQEIKHTQFLGYLLDPNESHGFRDEFLTRFIQSIPKPESKAVGSINILDYNLTYSKITKEKRFKDTKKILDLLIEIPSLAEPEKTYVIAIENKIKATEGDNQLETYRNTIKSNFQEDKLKSEPILLYLTINNEEPSDDYWIPIQYFETVIKAIKILIEDLEDTLSDYMIFILKDYIEFINKEGEYESDNTLEKILQDMSSVTIENAKEISKAMPKSIEHQRLEIRYQKALKYIVNYDTDPRKLLLDHFKSQFSSSDSLNAQGFTLESSNRNWMRFSFLNPNNRDFLSNEICINPTRDWLSSRCNLAFEFIFSKPKNNRVDFHVSLILGPTSNEYKNRTELLNAIKLAFNNSRTPGNPHANINTEANDHWDAIKRHAFQKYTKNTLSPGDAKSWIEKTLESIAKDEAEFIKAVNAYLKNEGIRNRLRM